MRKILIASLLAAIAAPAFAEDAPAPSPLTGNFTLTSEYLYRGITQSNNRPAVQGGFDYASDTGLYIGNWNSSISWIGDASCGGSACGASGGIEMDFYGGYKKTLGDFTFDIGALYYYYPGNYAGLWASTYDNPSTLEYYAAVGYKWITLKYSRASSNVFGNYGSKHSGYYEANFAYDLGSGWGMSAHAGHQQLKQNYNGAYSDYRVGVTKDVGFATVGLTYSMTTAHKEFYSNIVNNDTGKNRFVVNLTKTF